MRITEEEKNKFEELIRAIINRFEDVEKRVDQLCLQNDSLKNKLELLERNQNRKIGDHYPIPYYYPVVPFPPFIVTSKDNTRL